MSPESSEPKEKGTPAKKEEICERPLLCPEEWQSGEGEKVLGEYHSDVVPKEKTLEEADLDSFEQFWRERSAVNVRGEYHKEGAPHLERSDDWNLLREEMRQKLAEEQAASGEQTVLPEGGMGEPTKIDRVIDLHTVEVASYAIFRALFGRGIKVPIKREGFIDMEVMVKNKDIILNTKQLFPVTIPELVVWRVIFAYKGKPILEMGRGVKGGLKIHRWRVILLLVEVYRTNRRARKRAKALMKSAGQEEGRDG